MLSLYAVVKLGDVAVRGHLDQLVAGTFTSNLFVVELLVSAIIPAALLFIPAVRKSLGGIATAAFLAVAGFVMNRLDVGGIAMIEVTGTPYIPSWMEIVISLGVVAGAAVGVALFQFGLGTEFWSCFAVYLIIQGLDGNLLVPVLFSEAVNLHPLVIILSVVIFGGLWGFWGVFFAIPLAMLIKAVVHAWPDVPAVEEQ